LEKAASIDASYYAIHFLDGDDDELTLASIREVGYAEYYVSQGTRERSGRGKRERDRSPHYQATLKGLTGMGS
jgi:hypothetical protein